MGSKRRLEQPGKLVAPKLSAPTPTRLNCCEPVKWTIMSVGMNIYVLNTVRADGGGHYPESLNEGLHQAIHNVEWRAEDAIQLIFLVADAPPHLDYANDYDYAVEMEQAARRGIKILPIASSGLDDQGEYIFRQLAQFTQGRFIFLTYEGPINGGPAGDVTTHHVDAYSVANTRFQIFPAPSPRVLTFNIQPAKIHIGHLDPFKCPGAGVGGGGVQAQLHPQALLC